MYCPFKCLLFVPRSSDQLSDFLIASCGSHLLSFSVSDGSLLSTWAASHEGEDHDRVNDSVDSKLATSPNSTNSGEQRAMLVDQNTEPPEKRRKLSTERSDSTSAEIVVETSSLSRKSRSNIAEDCAVIILKRTSNCRHVIAVTGGDKCIRVFQIQSSGSLVEISKRYMPKRPCAIAMTTDDSTILCADKFGDVYSLPLLGVDKENEGDDDASADNLENGENGDSKKLATLFTPSANAFTVHTKRNQQALLNQLRVSNQHRRKKSLTFKHQLLLGHVSLLTDLIYVTLSASESLSGQRSSYIITSDRDEHIRVSRGLPQAHIIEGYCLGHTEFITKLCTPHWKRTLMISGGGDDYLLVWDWLDGNVRQRIDLKASVVDACNLCRGREMTDFGRSDSSNGQDQYDITKIERIAVSGIWSSHLGNETSMNTDQGEVIVACEGVPALFFYTTTSIGELRFRQCLLVSGNVLDVAVLEDQPSILYSMDNIHEPWSMNQLGQGSTQKEKPYLGAAGFCESSSVWTANCEMQKIMRSINRGLDGQIPKFGKRGGESHLVVELLYGIENLRKEAKISQCEFYEPRK